MESSDEELVTAFQEGDASAFDALVRRWDRRIQGAIYRMTGSQEEVLDLRQEAFLRAYRALATFKRQARFSSWLYQIALNLCRDRMRRKKGWTLVSLDAMGEEGASPRAGAVPTALDLVLTSDRARAVAAAVGSLPEDQREVIILKEYQGLTFVEIAEALGLPLSTVKTRLYRGLEQLRQRLERQGIRGTAPAVAPSP